MTLPGQEWEFWYWYFDVVEGLPFLWNVDRWIDAGLTGIILGFGLVPAALPGLVLFDSRLMTGLIVFGLTSLAVSTSYLGRTRKGAYWQR